MTAWEAVAGARRGRRRPGGAPVRQALVLAGGTWRLAWREPLTWILLALALLLTAVGSVAAIGSPTAGDGAIQMLAVCLQVVPFAEVLLAADLWRQDADEAVFARPVSAEAYVAGRALGLCLVGLALLGAVALGSVLGLWLVAALPLGPAAAWIAVFAAVYVAPGLVLLGGACAWWLARGGAGPRYHAGAILAALLLAFYSFKLDALAARPGLRLLAFFAPFPGFMTLGLALPPPELAVAPVPGWVWLNRAVFLLLGVVALLGAARRWGAGIRRAPLASPGRGGAAAALAVASLIAAAVPLALLGRRLAPPVAAAPPALPSLPARAQALALSVEADAGTGVEAGRAVWSFALPIRTLAVAANAGLSLSPPAGARLAPLASGLWPGTAARLYRISLPRPTRRVAIAFRGRLLPVPSALPYPPFPVGQAFEGAALGGGRAFFDGRGTWYPVPVGPGLVPAAAGSVRLDLVVRGGHGAWWGLPARRRGDVWRVTWMGRRLPAVLGVLAPYRVARGAGWTWADVLPPPPGSAAILATYARAARGVARTVPGSFGSVLRLVADPLLGRPLWADGILWLPSDQPFCVPPDPVAGVCGGSPPDLRSATLLLAVLLWQEREGVPADGLALAPTPRQAAAGALVAPYAAATAWRALGRDPRVAQAWTAGAVLPWIGRLGPAARALAARLAQA